MNENENKTNQDLQKEVKTIIEKFIALHDYIRKETTQ